jgi:hypothetical protein
LNKLGDDRNHERRVQVLDDNELIEIIRGFVAGDVRPREFAALLTEHEGFARLLDDRSELPEQSYVRQPPRINNTYEFVISCKLENEGIGGPLNAVGALCQFMDRRGIVYDRVTDEYRRLHEFALDVQPAWLDVDADLLKRNIIDQVPRDLSKTASKTWARARLREMFRYPGKPPRWVQSPNWPIRDGRPLIFMGQVTVENYFHDRASLFVFHDPDAGEFVTVAQVY